MSSTPRFLELTVTVPANQNACAPRDGSGEGLVHAQSESNARVVARLQLSPTAIKVSRSYKLEKRNLH